MNIATEKKPKSCYRNVTFSPGYLEATNYHSFIYKSIEPFLGNRIVEIGCGPGIFSRRLQEKEILLAMDICDDTIQRLKNDKDFKDNVIFIQDDIANFNSFNVCVGKKPDTVVCINVLEHIENDDKVLNNVYSLLKTESGRLIVLVPAFRRLYGRIDELGGHFRRYDKKELMYKLKKAHFHIEDIFYLNSLGVLFWPLSNLLLRPKSITEGPISSLFIFYDKVIVPLLDKLERVIKPFFGLSIIAIGRAQ
jgi:SAM-dependent methyltransferase